MLENTKKQMEMVKRGEIPRGWKEVQLKDIAVIIETKNTINNSNVLTISAQYGLISQKDFFKKEIASKNKENYYLLQRNDFAYNKSYSGGYIYGAVKRLKNYDMGIVSPLYICFRVIDKNISLDYLEYYFEYGMADREIRNVAQEGARNHGLLNISTKDFFNIKIVLPTYEEQKIIAEILMTTDKEIILLEKKLELIKQEKKAIMQLLLTGIVRVGEENTEME
jgi:type I restriction enzyme S subunit